MQSLLRAPTLKLVLATLATSIISLSAQAGDPRIGAWRLNVAKSKYSPGPALKSQIVKVEPSGQGEEVTSEVANADGTRTTMQYTANYDGQDYRLTGSQIADVVSHTRIDARTTERADKKGGKVVQTLRRVVSQDGKTMTVTIKGTNAQGQAVSNVAVFEKQ